jgi:hypothetical protein
VRDERLLQRRSSAPPGPRQALDGLRTGRRALALSGHRCASACSPSTQHRAGAASSPALQPKLFVPESPRPIAQAQSASRSAVRDAPKRVLDAVRRGPQRDASADELRTQGAGSGPDPPRLPCGQARQRDRRSSVATRRPSR